MSWPRRLVACCFFLSGMCGLIYQVVWARYLGLFIGNTTYAHAIVLAAFMGGLAAGNAIGGRWADRYERFLTWYAWLEMGIGLYGALSPSLLVGLGGLFQALGQSLEPGSPGVQALKFALAFPAVFLPAVLMGGTTPFIARAFIGMLEDTNEELARLYAVNSAGAVVGAVASAFLFIPRFGLAASLVAAALLNILVGLVVIAVRVHLDEERIPAVARRRLRSVPGLGSDVNATQLRCAVWVIGLSGLTSMFYELAWFRLFALVLGSSTYSFALMLAAFISGITLGSLWLARLAAGPRRWHAYTLLAWCEIGIGLAIAGSLPVYERLPFWFNQVGAMIARHPLTFPIYEAVKYTVCVVVMVIPTIFFGMSLPLVSRLSCRQLRDLGRAVGNVFAVNTIGAMLGSLLAGFLILPAIGLQRTLVLATTSNALLGGLLLAVGPHRRLWGGRLPRWVLAAGMPLVVCGLGLIMPTWRETLLNAGAFRRPQLFRDFREFRQAYGLETVYHRDGSQATVIVQRLRDGGLVLKVNGKPDASTGQDMKTQVLSGHIPLLLHPAPRQVLNVGIGSGVTCGSILSHPVDRLDTVEISQEVIEGSRFFHPYNGAYDRDPRTRIYREDAKTFFRLSRERYDVIVSEPSNPWMAGVGSLFSVEYFQSARDHLAAGGIMAQWLQAYEITDDTLMLVLRTFASVFPYVEVWGPRSRDLLLVGSLAPLAPEWPRLAVRLAHPAVASDLARIQVADVPTLLVHQLMSAGAVRRFILPGALNSDYFPDLEYQAPKDLFARASANDLFRRDERRRPAAATDLYLGRYLRGRELADEDFQHLYAVLREDELVRPLATALVAVWTERFPESAEALGALLRFNTLGVDQQLALYQRALAHDQDDPELVRAFLRHGYWWLDAHVSVFAPPPEMGEWARVWERAATLQADSAEALHTLRAAVWYRRGELSRAIGELRETLQSVDSGGGDRVVRERRLELLRRLVSLYFENGEPAAAREVLRQLIAEDPQDPRLQALLAALEPAS